MTNPEKKLVKLFTQPKEIVKLNPKICCSIKGRNGKLVKGQIFKKAANLGLYLVVYEWKSSDLLIVFSSATFTSLKVLIAKVAQFCQRVTSFETMYGGICKETGYRMKKSDESLLP